MDEWMEHGIRFEPGLYNKSIRESPGYKGRVESLFARLRDNYLLADEQIESLHIEQRTGMIPFRLLVDLAIRISSFGFKDKHGMNYPLVDAIQAAHEIGSLENGRVERGKTTPVQDEYLALWAAEEEKIYAEVKEMKRHFPPQAYSGQPGTVGEVKKLFEEADKGPSPP